VIDGLTVTFAGILQGGAVAVLVVVFFMVMNGKLVTRRAHEERVQDAKDIAALWRATAEASETARRETESLARDNLETSRAVLHLMHSLRSVAFREDEADAPNRAEA
jgi:hypothetical protein